MMTKKIYLVTGAAGFLGGTICRQLVERGDKVRAFVLPNDAAAHYLPESVEIVEGDLCNLQDVRKLFEVGEGIESIVLHIASIVTVNPEYSPKVMEVNVGGTKNILQVMKEHPECHKLVYCSSTGAIPEVEKGNIIAEINDFSRIDPDKVKGCYSQSKAMATQLVLDAVKNDGINACVIHPSGILGPEDYAVGETTKTLMDIIKGKMPAGIDGSFNLCDVRDLAAGAIAAADKGNSGECYILGNEEVSFKHFSKLIVEETNCKKIAFFLPIKLAYIMADFMEKSAKKNGKKPLLTKFSVYNLARNNHFDSSKAKKELGYTTRSYRETIHDEVAWLKNAQLI